MMDTREERFLLGLGQIRGMEQAQLWELMDRFGSAEEAWDRGNDWFSCLSLPHDAVTHMLKDKKELKLDSVWEYRERLGVKIVTSDDPRFPEGLRHVDNPPYVLYYLGTLPKADHLSIGVVGGRKCTEYGRLATEKIVTELVEMADVQIVNGMAEGVDGVALRSALKAGGYGLAFLGSGIDIIYPSFHRKLYAELKEKGCIMTEYPFGMPCLPHHFPIRNRLISGASHGILVTEAKRNSGTMHTVIHGLEQGKNIYAVPGSVFSPMSGLPHYLLENGHAKFTPGALAILEDFIPVEEAEKLSRGEKQDPSRLASDEKEQAVLAALKVGRRTFDELIDASGLTPARLMTFLSLLELEGEIKETPGNTYMLMNP